MENQNESPLRSADGPEGKKVDRRDLLRVGAALGATAVASHLGAGAAQAYPDAPVTSAKEEEKTVLHLGPEFGEPFAKKMMKMAGAKAIDKELRDKHRLTPMPERTQVFSIYSQESETSIAIGVIPYVRTDKTLAAGLSVSQGGYAKAVLVDVPDGAKITNFTSIDVTRDQVTSSKYTVADLKQSGVEALAKKAGVVKSEKPLVELTVKRVGEISTAAFSTLVADASSKKEHTPGQITTLLSQTAVAVEIGHFMLLRSTASPGGCSCSSSCWGCSTCSCSWG